MEATCQRCGAVIKNPVSEPSMYEVIVRQVQRRNVPLVHMTVCDKCAIEIVSFSSKDERVNA